MFPPARQIWYGLIWRLLKILSQFGINHIGKIHLLCSERIPDSSSNSNRTFFPEETAIRAPNIPEQRFPARDLYPAVSYSRLENALVTSNRRVAGVICGSRYFVAKAAETGPWNIKVGELATGGVLRQANELLMVAIDESQQRLPRGIFVGTWTPHNWFHWTIDTLPSIFLTKLLPEEFSEYPLILPEMVLLRESWREPLELLEINRPITYVTADKYTSVSELIWMDSPTCPGPVPLSSNPYPKFRVHGSALRAYRQFMLDKTGLASFEPTAFRKIFLARQQTGFRPYNQAELFKVAAEFGYEAVFLEDLNFPESIKVMLEAESVIGPHGAGWANAIFARPGTHGLMWTWPASARDNWFTNIGAVAEMNFHTIFTDLEPESFSLNPGSLRRELKKLPRR